MGFDYKKYKAAQTTPFEKNFGIGRTNAPDATTPFNQSLVESLKTGFNTIKQSLQDKKNLLESSTDKIGDFFKKSGIQIGKNVEMLGGGSGQDWKSTPKPEDFKGTQEEYDKKTKADWQTSKTDARQKGWGQVLTKSLAAGMRTLPGGYDAYNPPGDVDMMKHFKSLNTDQQQALLQQILGDMNPNKDDPNEK